ncbi:hypothetical protein FRB98_005187, partial [Tulasnella sp. 332]
IVNAFEAFGTTLHPETVSTVYYNVVAGKDDTRNQPWPVAMLQLVTGPSRLPIYVGTSTSGDTTLFDWSILHEIHANLGEVHDLEAAATNFTAASTSFIGPVASLLQLTNIAPVNDHFVDGVRAIYNCRQAAYVSTSPFALGLCIPTAPSTFRSQSQTPGTAHFRRECIDWKELAIEETPSQPDTFLLRLSITALSIDHSASRPKEHVFASAMALIFGICIMVYGTIDRLNFPFTETPQETDIEQSPPTHETTAAYEARLRVMATEYDANIADRDIRLVTLASENDHLVERLKAVIDERDTIANELNAAREIISIESANRALQSRKTAQLEEKIRMLQDQVNLAVDCHASCTQQTNQATCSEVADSIARHSEPPTKAHRETVEPPKSGRQPQRKKMKALGSPNKPPNVKPNTVDA